MESVISSLVSGLGHDRPVDGNPGKVHIIVPQARAYLATLLAEAFQGRKDVEVIVDRRHGERRTRKGSAAMERRWAERRQVKQNVIEVVIEMRPTRPQSPPGGPT